MAREDPTRDAAHPSLLLSSGDKLIDSPPPIFRPANCFEEIWRQRERLVLDPESICKLCHNSICSRKSIKKSTIDLLNFDRNYFHFISLHCKTFQMELSWNFNQSEFCLLSIYFICSVQTSTWSLLLTRNIFKAWIYKLWLKKVYSHSLRRPAVSLKAIFLSNQTTFLNLAFLPLLFLFPGFQWPSLTGAPGVSTYMMILRACCSTAAAWVQSYFLRAPVGGQKASDNFFLIFF